MDFTLITDSTFIITIISTGGPATIVTWTRDTVTITEGTKTVLDNRVTAQYTHTLTVNARLDGLYTCTVNNDKPSNISATITVQGNNCAEYAMLIRIIIIIIYFQLPSLPLM